MTPALSWTAAVLCSLETVRKEGVVESVAICGLSLYPVTGVVPGAFPGGPVVSYTGLVEEIR